MDAELRNLLSTLYAEGAAHDAEEADRTRRLRNVEPATAELLTFLLRATGARDVVEVGTSNGYSAIWLADAARDTGGTVTTVDIEDRPGVAGNFARAGVDVRRELTDAADFLAGRPDASIDLLFLDAERTEYASWWPHPARVLRPGGVLAVDNVLSHPEEVEPLLALIAADANFVTSTVAVGKGLHLAWRRTTT